MASLLVTWVILIIVMFNVTLTYIVVNQIVHPLALGNLADDDCSGDCITATNTLLVFWDRFPIFFTFAMVVIGIIRSLRRETDSFEL